MNRTATYVRNRLSLRSPQEASLAILAELAEILTLEKGHALPPQLDAVREKYPTCTDFERTFPSMCFALATGVGKTRLILERDADVLKRLRPARNQFRLYWRHNSRQYVPDLWSKRQTPSSWSRRNRNET